MERPVDAATPTVTGGVGVERAGRAALRTTADEQALAPRGVEEPPSHLRDAPAGARAWLDVPDLAGDVERARKGDEGAFRIIYRDIQPRILRYLSAIVGDDAEDVASETWLHVARDLPSFTGDSDGFRGWVATIARHRATDHLRRSSRRPQRAAGGAEALAELAASDDTAARALETIMTDAALGMIAELPRDQAEAVLLRVVVGLDATGAGRVLGKRPGAVRTAAYRGLRKLGERLETQRPHGDAAPGAARM